MLTLPKDFETYDEKRRNAFLALYEEKKKGKKVVGTFCSYTPTELIHAVGAIPVGLCGNSEQGIMEAETRLPKTLCPLIKSSYGLAMTEQCPFFYFSDGVLAETTCDGKKKTYELLGEIKPVHVMKLPQGKDHALALESWTEEIRLTASFLEKLFGVRITEEKLHDAIVYRNRVRKALIGLYEVAKVKPSPVSGYELTTVSESADFHFTDDSLIEKLEAKTREFRSRIREGAENRPRVLVTGCPNTGVREKLIRRLEDLGADYVCSDHCAGPRTLRFMVDEEKDPYEALAERYLKINCSVMSPNEGRFDDLKHLVSEYQVDGVLEIVLQGCHTFAVEAYHTWRTINEQLGLPYLRVDTDFSRSDGGQIETRLGAFIEMMTN
ncbi:double-cubane-cluster-containing anaerobic reductase [Pyramidobacter sp. YE332]|uniref:double-cubane-cluster-containing anaerobic reductase n=1 Tax=Pyramidobacter sp. YE332 TaxID=3068894 RepID=UPI00294ABF49|nr:double-cubane-cluster-containing anaerobic reductase [Pyramidobacter sp. YE332]WOL40688.1 double-cubane-cluster-containing anaerobic reductase [Pyramidobacter sp. YE332]